jgi:hypothetical protein
MIDTTNYEFLAAHFSNNEKTIVTVYWGNKDETIEEIVTVEEDNPAWERLLKHIDIDTLHEATYNHIKSERQDFESYIISIAERDGLWGEIAKNNEDLIIKVAESLLLDEDEIDAESLFKVKLKFFENAMVAESEDKDLKAELRKAKTYFDALAAFRKFKK